MTPRDKYLQKKYGINEAQYDALAAFSDNRCWVCYKPPNPNGRRLHLEHDHHTKRVRGLTCWACNTAIKWFKDNPKLMRAAANYLEADTADQVLAAFRANNPITTEDNDA